jgi:soluble lytic murein transglycosylase
LVRAVSHLWHGTGIGLCVAVALVLAAGPGWAQPAPGERQVYRAAVNAAQSGNWGTADYQAGQVKDPALNKLVLWFELTRGSSGARFADISDFILHNPDWPGQVTLRQRAEEALVGVPDSQLREWFARFKPVTPYGRLRQAELLMAQGQPAAAAAQIREVWITSELSVFDEKSILQRFPGIIRSEDHIKRLDRLVWDGLADSAKRMMPRVPADYRLLADARLKLAAARPGVEGAVAKVPAHLQNDPGLLFERLRWRRRKEMYAAAIEMLLNPPKDLVRPAAWWTERQVLARHALSEGKAQLAYRLVSKHGLSDGTAYAEAEFLAGWIALRFLSDGRAAYDHFASLYGNAKLPISLARGAYWAGRAAETQGLKDLAQTWYAKAAQHATTYYGQLATARLTGGAARVAPEPKPSAEERSQFHRRELVRVVQILSEAGALDRTPTFLQRLSEIAASPVEHAMIADLAEEIGRPDLAVAAAKRAGYAGVTLIDRGYPVLDLPSGSAERPLVLAMTRQESAFEREAVSRSGARGLMQLMPATASHIAKARQMPFSADRLLTDGRYNIALGRAYLEDLLDRFGGSYVLAIAAYNAGPGRVREWMDDHGDPRAKSVDVVDWVESIPFTETRNYVQRVLENLQVYRMRLGDHTLAFSLTSDLRR